MAPANILPPAYRKLGILKRGSPADLVLLDPTAPWVVDPTAFASKGRNTPLAGCTLQGRVVATVYGGQVVYEEAERATTEVRRG